MRNIMSLMTVAAVTGFVAATAHADNSLSEYTWQGVGSGTLGSSTFTDAAFTVTSTSHIAYRLRHENADNVLVGYSLRCESMISIEGLGSFDFTETMSMYVNFPAQELHFGRRNFAVLFPLINQSNPVFANWDLFTDIAPISDIGSMGHWSEAQFLDQVETDGGVLFFNTSSSIPLTFSASITPAPSTIGLAGAMGLLASRRRRRSHQA